MSPSVTLPTKRILILPALSAWAFKRHRLCLCDARRSEQPVPVQQTINDLEPADDLEPPDNLNDVQRYRAWPYELALALGDDLARGLDVSVVVIACGAGPGRTCGWAARCAPDLPSLLEVGTACRLVRRRPASKMGA